MTSDDGVLTGASSGAGPPLWRRPVVLGAVGAAAAAAVVITVVGVTGDDATSPEAATTVTYDLAGSGVISSCLPLAEIEPIPGAAALAGTVVSIEGDLLTIEVDRWYAGGDADRVVLRGTAESVALDGVEFVVGEDYLVTAADGVVQSCGVSAQVSPELEQRYDEWYG